MKLASSVMLSVCVLATAAAQQSGTASIERGRYIAQSVAMCVQCHTPREANGTLIRTKLFEGAAIPVGRPKQLKDWADFAPRIAGLPQYTSEQVITLLTTGIGREGKPLRAPMPTYKMNLQDAADVAAFLKSLR